MIGSRRRWAGTSVAVAVGMVALSGCAGGGGTEARSGGAPSAAAQPPAPEAPEERRAGAGEVAAGLRKIDQIARGVAAAGADKAKATELAEQIEPPWAAVEGTVKANDQDAYLTFEDAFAVLGKAAEAGDGAAAAKGAATVSSTVSAYLTKYPG